MPLPKADEKHKQHLKKNNRSDGSNGMSYYSQQQYAQNNEYDSFYYSLFFKKGQRILDIGCSTGNFLAQDPKHIIGLDSDADAVAIARKRGLQALQHDITKKLPFKAASLDNIHCKHVLEHLDNPLPLLCDIFRVLKNNGRLVLVTDRMTSHFWDDYTHKRPFTEISLRRLAWDASFQKCIIYRFPMRGVLGMGILFRHNLISSEAALRIYRAYATIVNGDSLVLDVKKKG